MTEVPGSPYGSLPDSLIDTHCHLLLLEERNLLEAALASAHDAGVEKIVSVGLNLEDSRQNCRIAESMANVWFTVGWHPHEVSAPSEQELASLRRLLSHPKAVAVGEIGLDLYFREGYHETPLAVQKQGLHAMFRLAAEAGKPVILHDREAHNEILQIMRQYPDVRGVMHCFSGDLNFAQACIELGYVISFSGIVTFANAKSLQEVATALPWETFVVETDAPFLTPAPRRGEQNLPGYVALTAAKIAALRSVTTAEVATSTTKTARKLFRLPQ